MKHAIASLLLGLVAAGCHGDGDDDGPSAPSGQTLVGQLITSNTTDSAEPVELNGLDLQFSESETAFDAFFP